MSKTPTHTIQLVSSIEGLRWPHVGAAWENKDGSVNLVLDVSLPKGARIQLRKRKPKPPKAKAPEATNAAPKRRRRVRSQGL